MVLLIREFLRREDGVTAIEYGLLAALIAVAITVGANAAGQNLGALFNGIAVCLTTASSGVACAL